MTLSNRDELDRIRFDWPEPLVIELICDHYAGTIPAEWRMEAAKLHQQALRADFEGHAADATPVRRQLSALYGKHGVGSDLVARIEQAVILELMRLVEVRFRHSPKLLDAYGQRLKSALIEIAGVPTPVSRSQGAYRSPAFRPPAAMPWRQTAA